MEEGAGDRGIEEGGRDRREGRDVKKRLAAFLCFPFIGSNLLTWFMYIFYLFTVFFLFIFFVVYFVVLRITFSVVYVCVTVEGR